MALSALFVPQKPQKIREMKNLCYLTLLFLFITSCKNEVRQNLTFSQYQFNFGKVKEGGCYLGEIMVYNRGLNDLYIRTAKADCKCIRVFLEKEIIAPRDSSILRFTFDSRNKYGVSENLIILEANTDSIVHCFKVLSDVEP